MRDGRWKIVHWRMLKFSRMVCPITLSLLVLVGCFTAFSQGPEQYFGKLDAELVPDMVHVYKRIYYPLKDTSIFRYETPLEKDAVIRIGELIDARVIPHRSVMLIVEPPSGKPYLWLDQNGNGKFETDERIQFRPDKDSVEPEVIAWLPIKNAYYKKIPVYISY